MTATEREATFQRWTRDHGAILYRVAAAFAAGAERDDLMQELLIGLWSAVPAFRGEAQPSTFIYRVAHNAALAWKRSARRRDRGLEVLATLDRIERTTASDDDQRERLEHVYAAIRQLPPLDRSLILLALDGLSYREIGAVHGMKETAIGARLSRCRARLAHQLKEILNDPR